MTTYNPWGLVFLDLLVYEWLPNPDVVFKHKEKRLGADCCCCLVTKSCQTLCNPMDCSLPDSSVHGFSRDGMGCHFILQRIFPTQGSNPRLLLRRQILYHWATWGALGAGYPGLKGIWRKSTLIRGTGLSMIGRSLQIFIWEEGYLLYVRSSTQPLL